SLAFLAVIAGVLFGCAGRWDLPFFWAYLGVRAARSVIGVLVTDPTLIKERLLPGPGGQDFLSAAVLIPLWFGQHVVAGLDVGRYHWTDTVPLAAQVIGLVAMAGAVGVQVWAVAVNRFFSSVIRIQADRGHHVITDGPYRFVRHPAYASWPFFIAGAGLALGSWLATLIGVILVF